MLERDPDRLKIYLKLKRKKFVTVVFNTEHVVHYRRYGDTRAASRSVATRIAEIVDPGSPNEREKPEGRDRGFLWRLNSYWRYEQVPEGVIVECESVSLSRDIPRGMKVLIRRMVNNTARESMERTLRSMRERFTHPDGDHPTRLAAARTDH